MLSKIKVKSLGTVLVCYEFCIAVGAVAGQNVRQIATCVDYLQFLCVIASVNVLEGDVKLSSQFFLAEFDPFFLNFGVLRRLITKIYGSHFERKGLFFRSVSRKACCATQQHGSAQSQRGDSGYVFSLHIGFLLLWIQAHLNIFLFISPLLLRP